MKRPTNKQIEDLSAQLRHVFCQTEGGGWWGVARHILKTMGFSPNPVAIAPLHSTLQMANLTPKQLAKLAKSYGIPAKTRKGKSKPKACKYVAGKWKCD